jgi:hypothetical protein
MSSMIVYDIKIILKDKSINTDTSGPYFGSYLDKEDAIAKASEYEKEENVFMTLIETSSIMA